jgi:hypothetical protein
MSVTDEILLETKDALERVQSFDATNLVRQDVLGKYAFNAAVEPARKLIQLFSTLSLSSLSYFPDQQLTAVKDLCNSVFNLFKSVEEFDVENAQPSVKEAQDAIVKNLDANFQHAFNILSPIIAFAAARSQDFTALERDARAATQAAQDQAAKIIETLSGQNEVASRIIQEVRAAAAEQGVGNQALHFKTEADKHGVEAGKWLKYTVRTSIGLGIYSLITLFSHNIDALSPSSYFETVQILVSKALVFSVIAFMLFLCSRNFMSHRHNEVVNRHRQNALATFTALVEAANDPASSDIILNHASACIFAPQDTGYAKQDGLKLDQQSILQMMPRVSGSGGAQPA